MTESKKPTPEEQNSPAAPDAEKPSQENSSTPERDGFFKRVRRGLHEPIHPSEAKEIVVDMEGEGEGEGEGDR